MLHPATRKAVVLGLLTGLLYELASLTVRPRADVGPAAASLGSTPKPVLPEAQPTTPRALEPTTTIVTAMIRLKSKHSADEYVRWGCNFLAATTGPLVIFMDPASKAAVAHCLRNDTLVWPVKDAWDIPKMAKYREKYATQTSIDPEYPRIAHSPELYAVWTGKTAMVEAVVERNPFWSTWFAWVDMGSFREAGRGARLAPWPDNARVQQAFAGCSCCILVARIGGLDWKAWPEGEPPLRGDAIQAGIVVGSAVAFEWWAAEFWAAHDKSLSLGHFVGKEQLLYNGLVVRNRHRVLALDVSSLSPSCGDPWFAFHFSLAPLSKTPPGCSIPSPALLSDGGTGCSAV